MKIFVAADPVFSALLVLAPIAGVGEALTSGPGIGGDDLFAISREETFASPPLSGSDGVVAVAVGDLLVSRSSGFGVLFGCFPFSFMFSVRLSPARKSAGASW